MNRKKTRRNPKPQSVTRETMQQALPLTALVVALGAGLGVDVPAAVAAGDGPAQSMQKYTPSPTQSMQYNITPNPTLSMQRKIAPNPALSMQRKIAPNPALSMQRKIAPNPLMPGESGQFNPLEDPTDLMTIDKAFD